MGDNLESCFISHTHTHTHVTMHLYIYKYAKARPEVWLASKIKIKMSSSNNPTQAIQRCCCQAHNSGWITDQISSRESHPTPGWDIHMFNYPHWEKCAFVPGQIYSDSDHEMWFCLCNKTAQKIFTARRYTCITWLPWFSLNSARITLIQEKPQ